MVNSFPPTDYIADGVSFVLILCCAAPYLSIKTILIESIQGKLKLNPISSIVVFSPSPLTLNINN